MMLSHEYFEAMGMGLPKAGGAKGPPTEHEREAAAEFKAAVSQRRDKACEEPYDAFTDMTLTPLVLYVNSMSHWWEEEGRFKESCGYRGQP
jgi:hypothetical protein